MACYHPSQIHVFKDLKTNNFSKIMFQPRFDMNARHDKTMLNTVRLMEHPETGEKEWFKCVQQVLVPCGHCVGCSSDISRDWSYRMLMEKEMSKNAWFLTLTYDDEHIPKNHQLSKEELDTFIKKLRNFYYDLGLKDIRYYACGEYGSKSARPHYHMIVYNLPLTPLEFSTFHVTATKECYKNKIVKKIKLI